MKLEHNVLSDVIPPSTIEKFILQQRFNSRAIVGGKNLIIPMLPTKLGIYRTIFWTLLKDSKGKRLISHNLSLTTVGQVASGKNTVQTRVIISTLDYKALSAGTDREFKALHARKTNSFTVPEPLLIQDGSGKLTQYRSQ